MKVRSSEFNELGRKMNCWKRLLAEEDGPTAVEYAFLLTFIVLASVGTLGLFGSRFQAIYVAIVSDLPE